MLTAADHLMPIELQIIRAGEFIRVGARGHFNLKASKAVLVELAGACRKRGINQALLDLRDLEPGPKPMFSPSDLATLVRAFHEFGFVPHQRIAVLYHSDPHFRARLFAFIGGLRGWKVQAFAEFEEAIAWLAASDAPEPETELPSRGKHVVPLHTRRPRKSS
jgi:hypothetical protein